MGNFLHNRLTVVPTAHYVDELIAKDVVAALDRTADINVNTVDVVSVAGWFYPVMSAAIGAAENCLYTDG